MQFLKKDVAVQWYQHTRDDAKVTNKIYKEFKQFLLNLIANSINRRLMTYERWEEIKQKFDQKVSVFKIFLKNLKSHLFDF